MNGFAGPLESGIVELGPDPITVGCVKIEVTPERLIVAYEYDDKCGGRPPRRGKSGAALKEVVAVGPGSWARVKYNGRFVGDEWWYEKVVVNVGLFRRHEPGAFCSTEPAYEVTHMAELR
ncbi:MAG TPA: hypothetical protein VF538_07060 [Pyrinomonadaceae bacterium]